MSVTIIVVPRERFSHAQVALETLYANTQIPFQLIYVDNNSPRAVARYLRHQSVMRNFTLLRVNYYVSPNHARNLALAHVTTEFVLFLDNDCEVAPDCVAALLRCAQQTHATAVSPVYFERDDRGTRMHMAGAKVAIVPFGDVMRDYVCTHWQYDPLTARREPTDLFEFHCVLVRRSALEMLDEWLLSALEQEDLALQISRAGGTIWFEPKAQVTYKLGDIERGDRDYVRLRWSEEWNRKSVDHFRTKWALKDGWGEDTFAWCNNHRNKLLGQRRGWRW